MSTLSIDIPEEIITAAKIPRKKWDKEIKRELALQLYREGIFSFSSARRLSGLSKVDELVKSQKD